LAELSMKQMDVELAALEKTTPLDLVAAERTKKTTDEDWKRFNETQLKPLPPADAPSRTDRTSAFRSGRSTAWASVRGLV
jgi:hypothetical protein